MSEPTITVELTASEARSVCRAVEAYVEFLAALTDTAAMPCGCSVDEDGLRPVETAAAKVGAGLLIASMEI